MSLETKSSYDLEVSEDQLLAIARELFTLYKLSHKAGMRLPGSRAEQSAHHIGLTLAALGGIRLMRLVFNLTLENSAGDHKFPSWVDARFDGVQCPKGLIWLK